MPKTTCFLFGAAEKGEMRSPIPLFSVEELFHKLGNPPEHSEGISYAVQALLVNHGVIFFRVEEEGYGVDDYLYGLTLLQKELLSTPPHAICMPGVGDPTIIQAALPLCHVHKLILVLSEKDFYDYWTAQTTPF